MKKFMLGGLAAAAVIAPIALTAGSASAATTTSNDPACVPVSAEPAVEEQSHPEYKYRRADGRPAHNVEWSINDVDSITVDSILDNRDGATTKVVIDSPAVEAVEGLSSARPR